VRHAPANESKHLVDQRFDRAAFHQPRDFSQLFSVAPPRKGTRDGVMASRSSASPKLEGLTLGGMYDLSVCTTVACW